jgi:hypothetical protein
MPIAAFQLATVRWPKDRKGRYSSKVLESGKSLSFAGHLKNHLTASTIPRCSIVGRSATGRQPSACSVI